MSVMAKGYIIIEDLRVFAYIGVLPQETEGGNMFSVDIRLSYRCDEAMAADAIDCAVDYAGVVELVKAEMSRPSMLLEKCVERIRRSILERYNLVTGGSITLRKLNPPIDGEIGAVGFEYEW